MREQGTEPLLPTQWLHAWHDVHIVIILHIINKVGIDVVLELHLRFDLAGWVLSLVVHTRKVIVLILFLRTTGHHFNCALVNLRVLNPLVDRLALSGHLWT